MKKLVLKENHDLVRHGYEDMVKSISSPKDFYARITTYALAHRPAANESQRLTCDHISVLFNSVWKLGIQGQDKRYFWKLLATSFFRNPKKLPLVITMMIYGFHFHRLEKAA